MRILIVKIGAIGDVLMARGMLEAVPKGAKVSWLCGKSVAPLVREFEGISEIIQVDDQALLAGSRFARFKALIGIWIKLFGRRFDLVATGHSDPRYGLLSRSASAKTRRSFATERLVPGRLHADEYLRLITGMDGPGASHANLRPLRQLKARSKSKAKAKSKNKTALIFPGGAKNLLRDDHLRRWPLAHYATLAKLLIQHGWKVTLGGSKGDRWVLSAFEGLKVHDEIGSMSLPQTLDACAASDVVVTHDSGPLHLALATPARVVAIFGPTRPDEKVQMREGLTVMWSGEFLACRPCYDGKDYAPCPANACMSYTTPWAVLAAVEGKIARK